MQLAPVTANQETDELIQAIQKDPLGDGDTWDLHQDLDAVKINAFLDEALSDARKSGTLDAPEL